MTKLMAIGDLLFNGVRSLTINGVLAQWSAPSQVAQALGVTDFAVPDYPANVVINFENWVSKILNVVNIEKDLHNNIALWETMPKSKAHTQFDNISIASSTYSDMWMNTAEVAQGKIDGINADIRAGRSSVFDNLADLFFAYNTRFLMNPSDDPAMAKKSAIDIVTDRQPERLIVSIGANNGLWDMAFGAQACPGLGRQPGLWGPQDVADLDTFIEKLLGLPAGVEQIYLNALPRPSCTAVMMPVDDDDLDHKPGPARYYATYENRFGFNYATLTAAQVTLNDQIIDQVNQRIAAQIAGSRIHLVPVDTLFTSYDFKTNGAAKTVPGPDRHVISNIMIDEYSDVSQDAGEPPLWFGGLMGLDGMHPTIVGYNLMAQSIVDTIVAVEGAGVAAGKLPTLKDAIKADKLVSAFPGTWDDIMQIWLAIRKASALRGPPAPQSSAPAVAGLMKHVQFKTN